MHVTSFKDSPHMTAYEKEKVFMNFRRFIKSDYNRKWFTKLLYNYLIQHCSFIAHYDLSHFYYLYFSEESSTKRFLSQFETGDSIEYGHRFWLEGNYSDLNNALCVVVKEHIQKAE